jgi:ABC-type glycerol-3-phosphate transport system substrate-binding protein
MKRVFWLITIISLVFLVACSSDEADENTSKENESASLTLGLWNFEQAKVYEEVLEKFEKDNPNISVTSVA